MQEGIGRALLGQIVPFLMLPGILQRGMIFGMLRDELCDEVFQRREQFPGSALAPGFEQEQTRFIARRIE
jgi:hypothetical protein